MANLEINFVQYDTSFNKIMIAHRTHYKRNYQYSHPLAGTLYDNQRFVYHCSSYLDSDLKLSNTTVDDHSSRKTSSVHKIVSTNLEPTSKSGMYRVRNTQSVTENKMVCDAAAKIFDRQNDKSKASTPQNITMRHQTENILNFTSYNAFSKRNSVTDNKEVKKSMKLSQRRTVNRKMAIDTFVNGHLFPNINIRVINRITNIKEIESQTIAMSFEKIFKKIIKPQLMGQFTTNFLQKMEHYIRMIVENNEMYHNPWDIKLEQSFKTLSKKEELLDIVFELQMEGQLAKIHQIIKYYFIPTAENNRIILHNLLQGIVIELYEKKNCPKDIQYCLLNEQGQKITHISQVYFSTKNLLVAPQSNVEKTVEEYKQVLEDHDKQMRMTFKQSVKNNFIHKIVNNQVQEKLVNYTERPKEMNIYRKEVVQQAQSLLLSKSKKRIQRSKIISYSSTYDFKLSLTSPNDRLLYKYSQRKSQQRKEYKEIVQKLQKILDPNNKYYVKSRLDQKTQDQFYKLHRLNDQYDITYTHNPDNSNKLLLCNLLQNCHIFNTKSEKQLKRIMLMLNTLYSTPNKPLTEIFFWQFKQIYETAHGVSDKSVIMRFVLTYLCFDEYGEVSKSEVQKMVETAVSCEGRPLQLIKSIMWNWLQGFSLIENNVLRKYLIQIWYEPVRMVYLLFLSVIFGCQYKDLQEMVSQMIKYQFQ